MRTYFILLFSSLITFLLTACSPRNEQKVGVSLCSESQWQSALRDELQREAMLHEELGITFRSAHENTHQQIDDIRAFIAEGVNLLVVVPNVAENVAPAIEEAHRANIPIIIVDRKAAENHTFNAFVGSDDIEIGQTVGEYIVAMKSPATKQVLEVRGLEGTSPAIERHHGFHAVIKRYPKKVSTVTSIPCDWSEESAKRATDSLIRHNVHFNVIFAHNDRMAIGCRRALESAGRADSVEVVGIDALAQDGEGVDQIIAGRLTASCIHSTGGAEVIDLAGRILSGRPYPRIIRLQGAMVDSTNARIVKMQYSAIAHQNTRLKTLGKKIERQLSTLSRQQILLLAFGFIILLCITIALLLYRVYRKKAQMSELLTIRQEELERHNAELLKMSRELEAATNAKLTFYTNVNHDFRTPLTLIADPIRRLLDEERHRLEPSSEHLRWLSIADDNIRILLRLVGQILDLRGAEEGVLTLHLHPTPAGPYLSSLVERFRMRLESRSITLSCICHPEDEYRTALLMLDEEKMETIIYNIMGNAAKYTPAGGEVNFSMTLTRETLTLRFTNSGPGIPEDALPHIFESYYTTATVHAGSNGVGLALVRAYVELMGGSIHAENIPPGVAFIIEIPAVFSDTVDNKTKDTLQARREHEQIAKVDDLRRMAETEIPFKYHSQKTEKPNCPTPSDRPVALVVDDNEVLRRYVVEVLSVRYDILEASDGREGIERARATVPDIIVSDVMMPHIDGITLCRTLKADPATSHIPIILLTACSLDEQRIEGFNNGADSYIEKPFNCRVLLSRMDNLMAERHRLKTAFAALTVETEADNEARKALPERENTFLTHLEEVMEKRLGDSSLNVETLAEEMCLGRVQLYRKVKALTGMTVADMLRDARLKRARTLLRTTDMAVSQAGYTAGFSSASYFAKCYKERYGISPSEEQASATEAAAEC